MKIKFLFVLSLLTMNGCKAEKVTSVIPDLKDEPEIVQVSRQDMIRLIPAYGIAVSDGELRFEVNIEQADTAQIKIGASAKVNAPSTGQAVNCEVTRLIKNVSAETGQALAWLKPKSASPILPGEFIIAELNTGIKHQVLAVPQQAIFIRDGKQFVLRQDEKAKPPFQAIEVETGLAASGKTEITKGLKAEEAVIARGGLGFLYPDFKSAGD